MFNEDYFEYIKTKPYEEKLRAFGYACESMIRNSYESSRNGCSDDSRKYYQSECKAQGERAEFLFRELLKDYDEKGK